MRNRLKIAATALTLVSAPGLGAQTVPGASFDDAHVHLNNPAAWVRLMDETGIGRAIVFRGRDVDNAGLLEAARRWPDRLFPFLSVSPEHREFRGLWESRDALIGAVADSLLAAGGFFGIGEISVSHFPGRGFPEADFDPNGRVARSLLDAARRHDVPITLHVEVTRLREFEEVLENFRDVTVIWAHGGYLPYYLARRLLERHPNLIYELSARTWPRHPRSSDYTILRNDAEVWPEWIALIEEMPDRFLVGTDASLRSLDRDRGKIASVENLLEQLAPDVRRMLARENLDRILGLGGT